MVRNPLRKSTSRIERQYVGEESSSPSVYPDIYARKLGMRKYPLTATNTDAHNGIHPDIDSHADIHSEPNTDEYFYSDHDAKLYTDGYVYSDHYADSIPIAYPTNHCNQCDVSW